MLVAVVSETYLLFRARCVSCERGLKEAGGALDILRFATWTVSWLRVLNQLINRLVSVMAREMPVTLARGQ